MKKSRTFPGISLDLQEAAAQVHRAELEKIEEALKNKKVQTALFIMRSIASTHDWVKSWADADPDKYQHSMGEGSVFPTENVIKFSKDIEKVMKKWTKAGSSWKNHGESGATDSIHIKE
jgi:hypothetical protein